MCDRDRPRPTPGWGLSFTCKDAISIGSNHAVGQSAYFLAQGQERRRYTRALCHRRLPHAATFCLPGCGTGPELPVRTKPLARRTLARIQTQASEASEL